MGIPFTACSSASYPLLFLFLDSSLLVFWFLFFPLISSQDMSNSLQSQTELLTSSIWDHRSLKHTFCRITQIFACLPYSRNELWESDPVRFLASHGFYQVRKNTKVLVS